MWADEVFFIWRLAIKQNYLLTINCISAIIQLRKVYYTSDTVWEKKAKQLQNERSVNT